MLPFTGKTVGERIRYYRKQAGLTQKELANLCEISESAIRNYELGNRIPDWETLTVIAGELRVNYFAIADTDINALDGMLHALFKIEYLYGLYPQEVDGHIHLVFKDSIPLSEFEDRLDFITRDSSTMLQYRLRSYMEAAALHNAGELTDEEYALWQSKFSLYLEDFYKQAGREKAIYALHDFPISDISPHTEDMRRKRKVNN